MREAAAHYDIHDAETNLSRLVDRVEHGEEIVISRAGTPAAMLVPLQRRARRTGYGSLAGELVMSDDWDSPEVNDAIARDFGAFDWWACSSTPTSCCGGCPPSSTRSRPGPFPFCTVTPSTDADRPGTKRGPDARHP